MQNLANGQTLFLADETTGVPVRLEIRDGKQVFVQASYVGYFVTDREIQGLPRVAEGEVFTVDGNPYKCEGFDEEEGYPLFVAA